MSTHAQRSRRHGLHHTREAATFSTMVLAEAASGTGRAPSITRRRARVGMKLTRSVRRSVPGPQPYRWALTQTLCDQFLRTSVTPASGAYEVADAASRLNCGRRSSVPSGDPSARPRCLHRHQDPRAGDLEPAPTSFVPTASRVPPARDEAPFPSGGTAADSRPQARRRATRRKECRRRTDIAHTRIAACVRPIFR